MEYSILDFKVKNVFKKHIHNIDPNITLSTYLDSIERLVQLDKVADMNLTTHNHIKEELYNKLENDYSDLLNFKFKDIITRGNFGEKFYTNGEYTIKIFEFNKIEHCRSFISEILINNRVHNILESNNLSKIRGRIPSLMNIVVLGEDDKKVMTHIGLDPNVTTEYGVLIFNVFRPFVIYNKGSVELIRDLKTEKSFFIDFIENQLSAKVARKVKPVRRTESRSKFELKIDYKSIENVLFLEYLCTLWILKVVGNITLHTNGPLSTVLMLSDKKDDRITTFKLPVNNRFCSFDSNPDYVMTFINLDHSNVIFDNDSLHTISSDDAPRIIADGQYLTRSFCGRIGHGVKNPMHIWERVLDGRSKILKILKSLCFDFHKFNHKRFSYPITVSYSQIRMLESFKYNQLTQLLINLIVIYGSTDGNYSSSIDVYELLKARFEIDSNVISKRNAIFKVNERNNNLIIILETPHITKIVYPLEGLDFITKNRRLLIALSASNKDSIPKIISKLKFSANNYIELYSILMGIKDLLPTNAKYIENICNYVKESKSTLNSYKAHKLAKKWFNMPDLDRDLKDFIELGGKQSVFKSSKINNFIRRVSVRRSQWARLKESLKIAYPILNDKLINSMVSTYLKHTFESICTFSNYENITEAKWSTEISESHKERMIRIFVQFSYDFEGNCVIATNDFIKKKNITNIYDYIKEIVHGKSNLRSKLEMMFVFSRMLSYYLGKIFLMFMDIDEGIVDRSIIEQKIEKVAKLHSLNVEFLHEQYLRFADNVAENFRIKGRSKFQSGREYLKVMYAEIEQQIWMPLGIAFNYNISNNWPERQRISVNKGTPEYSKIPTDEINADMYEFIIKSKDGMSGSFKTRGVDNYLAHNVLNKSEKETLRIDEGHHPYVAKLANDYGLTTISGISGHAAAIIFTFKAYSFSQDMSPNPENDYRMALLGCIAYMLPRKDHTIMEMVEAVKGYGIQCLANGIDEYNMYNCLYSLIPETYTFNGESKSKVDYMVEINTSLGSRLNSFITIDYIEFLKNLQELISRDNNNIDNLLKLIESSLNRSYLENSGIVIKSDKDFYRQLYIAFCIMYRESAAYFGKYIEDDINMHQYYLYDMVRYSEASEKYSEYLTDYIIYKFEDDDITPVRDAHHILPLVPSFERNCLFFLKYYFKKVHGLDEHVY